jgi:DNA polymerase/3'-5' exonuclease PolX
MHLFYAQTIAQSILQKLEPYCDIINIAGSIRRKCQEVKDIELVLIPKKFNKQEINLFQEVVKEYTVIHPDFERLVKATGQVVKGKFVGRYMKIEVKQQIENIEYSISLDMFMPQPDDYYRQFAIRTGSADYSFRYIASMWRKKGWVGTENGLRLMKECFQVAENKWSLKSDVFMPTLPPVWKSENEFFSWLGVQYLQPEQRNL